MANSAQLYSENGTILGNVSIESQSDRNITFSLDCPPFEVDKDYFLEIGGNRRRILISNLKSNLFTTRIDAVFA